MNFDNASTPVIQGDTTSTAISLMKESHDEVVSKANNTMLTARDRIKTDIVSSGEAKALSDTLSVSNPQSIIEFGKPVSEQIGRCADDILRRQDINTLNQVSNMMGTLAQIMDKVDINELKEEVREPSFLKRLFNSAQSMLDKMVAKYNTVGGEIEKICIELRTYESQIEQSNKDLAALYENGIKSYHELVKYTIAGEMALEEIEQYKAGVESRAQSDPDAQMELANINSAQDLLAQRVQDLRLAETVALQSLPILKAMEFGNLNLSRKINSAFIVTIPVFKNAVAQAILAKKQAIQAQAMKALDDKTNEMLLRNAQNAANNMRMTAQLAGSSSIKVETIQQSWQTIMDGIKDTKNIQSELRRQREHDKETIENLNRQFYSEYQKQ